MKLKGGAHGGRKNKVIDGRLRIPDTNRTIGHVAIYMARGEPHGRDTVMDLTHEQTLCYLLHLRRENRNLFHAIEEVGREGHVNQDRLKAGHCV